MSLSKCNRFLFSLAAAGPLLFVLLLTPGAASPGELFVAPAGSGDCSQGDPCDLPTALTTASDGDTLYLMQGTYTGSGEAVVSVTRGITLLGGWDGTAVTPVSRDPDACATTLDGQDERRVIHISGDIAPTIDGFIITGGKAQEGGGIYVLDASPVIRNNVIRANRTIDGGDFQGGRGGGIYVAGGGAASVTGNHILDNRSGYGGGIYHYSSSAATIAANEIAGNIVSHRGGGIIADEAPDVVQSNVLAGNSAAEDGGGMLVWDADCRIEANHIVNNLAAGGAGISMGNGAAPSLINNLLVGNAQDGILVEDSSPEAVNNTIVGGGLPANRNGIRLSGYSGCSPPYCTAGVYTNNIVTGYEVGIYGEGTTPVIDYNDVWGNATGDYLLPAGVTPGPNNTSADPLFAGSGDYHLTALSPCIDSGSNDAPHLPAADKDGNPRIVNGTVDMGAYELHPVVYIAPDAWCDGNAPCYPSIQEGIGWGEFRFIIKAEGVFYAESLNFHEPKEITFQGGWDSAFENASTASTVESISIGSGKVIFDKGSLAIQAEVQGKSDKWLILR